MLKGKRVSRPEDVPTGRHWQIITFGSVYTPGDERSRTNPGHGYPASTDPVSYTDVYIDKTAWEADIAELENPRFGSKKPYCASEVTPAIIATSVSVSVG